MSSVNHTARLARGLFLTALGTLVLAFGVAVFIYPYGLIMGGVSGLSVIIHTLMPDGWIGIDTVTFVLSVIFFFVGAMSFGKDFANKTLLSSLLYPIFVFLLMPLVSENVLDGFFVLSSPALGGCEIIVAALFGGAFVGLGCAITFIAGGSTGGTDIVAFALAGTVLPKKASYAIFVTDALIIALGALVTRDLGLTLLGTLVALVCAVVIDAVLGLSEKMTKK